MSVLQNKYKVLLNAAYSCFSEEIYFVDHLYFRPYFFSPFFVLFPGFTAPHHRTALHLQGLRSSPRLTVPAVNTEGLLQADGPHLGVQGARGEREDPGGKAGQYEYAEGRGS